MPAADLRAASADGSRLSDAFPRFHRARGRRERRYLAELDRARLEARRFARLEIADRALDFDRLNGEDPRHFDWDLVRAAAPYRLLEMLIPTQAGGVGGLVTRAAVVVEELCAACPGIANIFGAHSLGLAPLLFGGPAHWDVMREIAAAARGPKPQLAAFAITEPDAGTDVEDLDLLARARISTRARPVPGGFALSGVKRFISNGSVARWATVFMPTDPRRAAETWTCFLVDTESPGFSVGGVEHKMGQRACPAAELVFDEVFVPHGRVVGREGDGAGMTLIVMAASRPPVGAIATGIARGAYERLARWLREDPAARGLLDRQHVQLRLARMAEAIQIARQAYMDAATEFDLAAMAGPLNHPLLRGLDLLPQAVLASAPMRDLLRSERTRETTVRIFDRSADNRALTRSLGLSSLAKARGSDVAMRVTDAALEMIGLVDEPIRAELEKLWRDAKLTQIYEGTNQLNRTEVYRALVADETMSMLPELAGPRHSGGGNGR